MKIVGFQKLTLVDYPGQVASTVFTEGCNFRCSYCYNSSLVLEKSTALNEEDILLELEKRKKND